MEPIWGGEGVAEIGIDDAIDEAIDSVAWGRGGSGKRRTPSRVAWKWRSPKNIGSAGVDELQFAELGAEEIMTLARVFPTDGANCRGATTADPLYDILGF